MVGGEKFDDDMIGGVSYSFRARDHGLEGEGFVDRNTEVDEGRCHTRVCDDEDFDEIVAAVAESYVPYYDIDACEKLIDFDCTRGRRNCKSWVDDVLEMAIKIYIELWGECRKCKDFKY